MRPDYKRVKAVAEFCPKCKERLRGNNSIANPWECACGIWRTNKYPFTGEYEIEKKLPDTNS